MADITIKDHLRERITKRRDRLTEAEIREAARGITEQFTAHVPLEKTDIIGGYWPSAHKHELDIRLLLETLEEEGYSLCLPVAKLEKKPLIFRSYKRGDVLIPHHTYNIEEPSENCKEMTPNVLICPLLAADHHGFRLGYGAGYYDRTISQLQQLREVTKRLLLVGVGYDFQLVDHVPTEPHDEALDLIITDKRVVICSE